VVKIYTLDFLVSRCISRGYPRGGGVMGMDCDLSKSCENTLQVYVNACEHHGKWYHFRGQKQTLKVKSGVFGVKRSIATLNRENAKLRDLKMILQKQRTTDAPGGGREFTSSLTLVTWKGIMYLIGRKILPHKFIRVWERICGRKRKEGPILKEVEHEITGYFLGVPMRKGIMSFVPPDEEIHIKPYVRKKNT